MFYRRKVLLSLLQIFDNHLDKIRLQKLLFLFEQQKLTPDYDFIPYKYGCYSYSANADLVALRNKGTIQETETSFQKIDPTDYISQLSKSDSDLLQKIKSEFGAINKEDLIRYTYLNYPFYAIKSEIAKQILSKNELKKIHQSEPKAEYITLFTIGYEGISLEKYLLRLLENNVKVLVDVRKNPLSMKYGFSKSSLKKYCESVDIQYKHIPELGIPSEQRKELHTQKDYDALFETYKSEVLTQTLSKQLYLLDLLKTHKRIALTCFEANICQCHRKHLAETIQKLPEFEYKIQHI